MYAAHQVGCYTGSVLRLSFCLHCCYYSTDTISFTAYCILIVLPTAGIHTDWTDACSCVMKQTQHCTSAPPSVSLILVIIIVITNIPISWEQNPTEREEDNRTHLTSERSSDNKADEIREKGWSDRLSAQRRTLERINTKNIKLLGRQWHTDVLQSLFII